MKRRWLSSAAFPAAIVLGLAGCAQPAPHHQAKGPAPDQVGIHVNDGASLFPEIAGAHEKAALPNLKEMEDMKGHSISKSAHKEMLKLPAIRDAALSYGVAGGAAWSTKVINEVLRVDAPALSKVYNFNRLVTTGPNGSKILPPVISESRNLYQSSDFGRTIRVANRYYKIIHQAQFVPNAPLWYSYLYRPWHAPNQPFEGLLPKNSAERAVWREYVKKGWKIGIKEGETIFRLDVDQLNRDFTGMIRYRALYEAGKVSAPVVKGKYLGTTGTGQNMREGDRVMKIISEPSLNVPTPTGSPIKGD